MDDSQPGLTELGERVAEAQDHLRRARGQVELARGSLTDALVSGEAFAGLRARRRRARRSSFAVALLLALAALVAVAGLGWLCSARWSGGSAAWLPVGIGPRPAVRAPQAFDDGGQRGQPLAAAP